MITSFILMLIALLFASPMIIKKKMQYWIFSYIKDIAFKKTRSTGGRTIDIIFCVVDHFEPGNFCADPSAQKRRTDEWVERYPALADKHSDADGVRAVHTWFFPPHDDKNGNLENILKLCRKGYGEIELHLHHDLIEPFPDSPETLKAKIVKAVDRYSSLGIFGHDRVERKPKFGFVHGEWALNNSRGGKHCGVNNEIEILSELGCYADFTFPCLWESQPQKINAIYYAKADPVKPKSHDTGIDAEAGRRPDAGDLMMIAGPIGLRLKKKNGLPAIAIEASNISVSDIPTPQRVRFWVNSAIHVKGRPEWIFIKVHTHGAVESNAKVLLGEEMHRMYRYLEEKYNDGKIYRLHYVTAREMYNIAKAAEAGEEGDPGRFRDYIIDKP